MQLSGVEVLGAYPRSDALRKAMRRMEEKGAEGFEEVRRLLYSTSLVVIGAQLGAGMTAVVDGLLDWHDMLRPFAQAWRGVYLDGLLRWFDNNFFYRIPVFVEPPDPQYYVNPPRIRTYKPLLPRNAKMKAVIPGPYTFLKLSKNATGQGDDVLMDQIAEILGREARLSVEAGAEIVQVEEPFMGDIDASRDEVEKAVEIVNERILKGLGAETRLVIQYSVPRREIYRTLLEVKTDYIVLDFADAPTKAYNLLAEEGCGGHGIGVGAIQARDLVVDDYQSVADMLRSAEKCTDKILLTTSAWLDLLPFNYAIEKTRILGLIASKYSGEQEKEQASNG